MSIPFPSDAWAKAFMDVLNNNDEYANVARNWEGDISFVIELEGSPDRPFIIYLDLWHGKCREAGELQNESDKQPAFTLRAPLPVFTRIVRGELDAMQAMFTRQLRVTGNMVSLMRNLPTVLQFVKCTHLVDTEFPA